MVFLSTQPVQAQFIFQSNLFSASTVQYIATLSTVNVQKRIYYTITQTAVSI
ncbi:hypothetical protein AG1IA_09234 [Rhizoctonia solani AG-1 IA]|uniref:Uncharacterized protein n=1 Tax=Thanatephorus cucumeris (strain AG1-IA) TaxID=983506 RepID=L8WEW8_THACA|nr:hypothetical protein AG1IA_09234 [Rhizoctonia solani AG-1 IA]